MKQMNQTLPCASISVLSVSSDDKKKIRKFD